MTAPLLSVKSWDEWQSYRRDRGQPPWVKLHRALLRDLDWVKLTDSQRGQLTCIWMLAADRQGKVPDDEGAIKMLCYLGSDFSLEFFIDQGFLVRDAKVTSTRRQGDRPEEVRGGQRRSEERGAGGKPPPPTRKKKLATRMQEDWVLPNEWLVWAQTTAPGVDASREADKFRDYWVSKSGRDATKQDWAAVWRNWIRRADEGGKHGNGKGRGKSAVDRVRAANAKRAGERASGGLD